jgi:hypothetical protein
MRLFLHVILVLSFFICSLLQADEENAMFLSKEFEALLKTKSTYSIAILPIQNATAVENLPYYFRLRLAELLRAKGYMIIDFKVIDDFLINEGVQTTDQIGLIDYDRLAGATSADAIISGIIETGTLQNALLYSGYAFTGSLKLEDRRKEMFWYNLSARVAKRRIAIDPINMLFNTALDSDDQKPIEAIQAVADKLLETFPQGPVIVIEDDLLNLAVEIKGK